MLELRGDELPCRLCRRVAAEPGLGILLCLVQRFINRLAVRMNESLIAADKRRDGD